MINNRASRMAPHHDRDAIVCAAGVYLGTLGHIQLYSSCKAVDTYRATAVLAFEVEKQRMGKG
jgi:hypothetical protein